MFSELREYWEVYIISEFFHFAFLFLWVFLKQQIYFVLAWIAIQSALIAIYILLIHGSNEKHRGRIIGYFGTLTGIIPVLAPPIFMFAKDHIGYFWTFLIPIPFIFIQLIFIKPLKNLRRYQ